MYCAWLHDDIIGRSCSLIWFWPETKVPEHRSSRHFFLGGSAKASFSPEEPRSQTSATDGRLAARCTRMMSRRAVAARSAREPTIGQATTVHCPPPPPRDCACCHDHEPALPCSPAATVRSGVEGARSTSWWQQQRQRHPAAHCACCCPALHRAVPPPYISTGHRAVGWGRASRREKTPERPLPGGARARPHHMAEAEAEAGHHGEGD